VDHETIDSDEWDELMRNLEATIPVYDRINRFATLGQVDKWRRMVRQRLPNEGDAVTGRVLEVGCGPGSFAEDVVGGDLVCLDPSELMLEAARPRVNTKREARGDSEVEFVQGKAEELPFQDNSFDGACSLFSFRDWYDKRAGLGEVLRVLKPGTKVVIVDPAKMNQIHGFFGSLWMRVWVGAYARIICGVKDHPWKWLTKTYVTFGTTRDYVRMMEEVGFVKVRAKVVFPGMATIWEGSKPEVGKGCCSNC
jgi:demethylmenaquinone methyltransferase/2-methoxy-6-polyprenyl-1,4-benzoquinol methylase